MSWLCSFTVFVLVASASDDALLLNSCWLLISAAVINEQCLPVCCLLFAIDACVGEV